MLKREVVTISMAGRDRAFDNIFVEQLWSGVKHEDVYLKGCATVGESLLGLTKYISFYNLERPNQGVQKSNTRRGVPKCLRGRHHDRG